MMHRIVEKSDLNGVRKFFPQKRKLLFWFSYYKTDMFPVEVSFDSYDAALTFINRQINQPKPKIYNIN